MSDPTADLRPLAFADLAGWAGADHAVAFAAFRRHAAVRTAAPPPSGALGVDGATLAALARTADRLGEIDAGAARTFFESRFRPYRVVPRDSAPFLTAYFEPELAGSRRPDDRFRVPFLARPDDLVEIDPADRPLGLDPALTFARRTTDGLVPYWDRAAIEAGALAGRGLELAWVEDPVDAYFAHVQGSVRIRLVEGGVMRLAYDGRNGRPYTSIAARMIARGEVAAEAMTAAVLADRLRADPVRGAALMRENASSIFFREQSDLDPDLGAVAAAGVPLTPGVSIAVDRRLHTYGTPVFLAADLPLGPDGAPVAFDRLTIAQDTGSAIVGPARADLFIGLGAAAGLAAGRVRHVPRAFVVLVPNAVAEVRP